jgi:iron complex outermembrane receptor protein
MIHKFVVGTDLYLRTYDRDRHSGTVTALNDIDNPVYGAVPTINYGTSAGFKSESDHLGFYAQDQIKIQEKLVLLLGGRADFVKSELTTLSSGAVSKQRDNAATGRAGLVYLFDSGFAPYASFSQSFTPQSGAAKNGNAFEPTEGTQYEAGFRYQPPNTNLMVNAAVYDLTQTNVLTTDPDDANYSVQTGEVRSRGVELESKASLGNFNLIASYAYTDARTTKTNTAANLGERVALVPYHAVGLWADYSFKDWGLAGLKMGAGLRYLSSMHITGTTTNSPDVTTVDALVSYDFGAVNKAMAGAVLTLNAKNLLDEENLVCVSLNGCRYSAPRTVIATLQYNW